MNTKLKKALYESIMKNVAKQVKKVLNESVNVWPCDITEDDVYVLYGNTFTSWEITLNVDLSLALEPDTFADIQNDPAYETNIIPITMTFYDDGEGGDGTYCEIDSYPNWIEQLDEFDYVDEELFDYLCMDADLEDKVKSFG